MCMHPNIYLKELWKEDFGDKVNRKKSTFMIGNFESTLYNKIKTKGFDILSRSEINDILVKKELSMTFDSLNSLNKYIESNSDKKCIVIN